MSIPSISFPPDGTSKSIKNSASRLGTDVIRGAGRVTNAAKNAASTTTDGIKNAASSLVGAVTAAPGLAANAIIATAKSAHKTVGAGEGSALAKAQTFSRAYPGILSALSLIIAGGMTYSAMKSRQKPPKDTDTSPEKAG